MLKRFLADVCCGCSILLLFLVLAMGGCGGGGGTAPGPKPACKDGNSDGLLCDTVACTDPMTMGCKNPACLAKGCDGTDTACTCRAENPKCACGRG